MLERLITNFKNIFNIPELRNRIFFTLGMLAVYRIGAHIPTPGINNDELGKASEERRNKLVKAGVAVGIGSAAIVAALLYASKVKKKPRR